MNCKNCGRETVNGAELCESCNGKKTANVSRYISIALAILGVVLPFLNWLEVPIANGLYSLFGMSEQVPKFSLFGYIFSSSQYQSDSVFVVMLIIALIALIGIIFNALYAAKALKNNAKSLKYGTAGAVILTVMSAMFIVIVGLMAAILKVIKLTATPYITLAVSVANIIVIKKLKKQA